MGDQNHIESVCADELVAPVWLDTQFFEEVLKKHEKKPELKVTELKISPASAKGDHYASIMFRALVSYTTSTGKESKSVIIKTMPEQEGHKMELIGNSKIFHTEIGMYTKAMPRFEQILHNAGDNTRLFAPCLYAALEPHQVMIFEDLVAQGYEVIRERDANIEELKLALQKLAKWQAVSFHLIHEEPEFLDEFKDGMFETTSIWTDPLFINGMQHFLELLEELPDFKKYIPHFKKLENVYMHNVQTVMQEYRKNRQPNGYYVLCHGDFHLKNMMLRKGSKEGESDDIMLLDFQFSDICPITMDLIYAIYMLMGPKERQNNCKELIDYYFSEFVDTLTRIGFKGEMPNSVEFWSQISKHKCYDIFLITTFFPMIIALNYYNFDSTELFVSVEKRNEAYRLPLYIDELKNILPRFEEQGLFRD